MTQPFLFASMKSKSRSARKVRSYQPRATSRDALASLVNDLGELQRKVYEVIERSNWNGRTCEEVEALLEMKHQTVSARIKELKDRKLIVAIGRRETVSGRDANVYVVRERP